MSGEHAATSVFTALKSIITFPWTCCRFKYRNKWGKNFLKSSDLNWARRQIESEHAHSMYPLFVHLAHCTELDRQMMRINTETMGTIAVRFVNLSNQWKAEIENDFGAFVLPFQRDTVLYAKQYNFHFSRTAQYELLQGDFLTVDYFLTSFPA